MLHLVGLKQHSKIGDSLFMTLNLISKAQVLCPCLVRLYVTKTFVSRPGFEPGKDICVVSFFNFFVNK